MGSLPILATIKRTIKRKVFKMSDKKSKDLIVCLEASFSPDYLALCIADNFTEGDVSDKVAVDFIMKLVEYCEDDSATVSPLLAKKLQKKLKQHIKIKQHMKDCHNI